jgi:hypothetical protein
METWASLPMTISPNHFTTVHSSTHHLVLLTHNLSSSNSTPPSQQRIRSNFIGTIPNNPLAFSILIPSLSLSPLLKRERKKLITHLDKPDILRLLSKRLATHVQPVFADDAGFLLVACYYAVVLFSGVSYFVEERCEKRERRKGGREEEGKEEEERNTIL